MAERFDDLEPMPTDVLSALDAERQRPGLSPERHAALAAKIAHAIAALPPPPVSAPTTSGAASTAGAAAAATGATKGTAALVAIFTAGAVAGGAGGAALHARYAEPTVVTRVETKTVYVEVPVAAPPAVAPAPPPPPAPAPAPAPRKVSDGDLSREREILELARGALARGNATEALDAVGRHERQFPRGRLNEEREAIAIQALVAAGRTEAARNRAEAFRKSFPESLLRPVVDALMGPGR